MPREQSQLCRKYHQALVRAIGDQVEQVKSRIASDWVNEWRKSLNGPIEDPDDFRQSYQKYLEEELAFADRSEVFTVPDGLEVEVEGCIVCEGNEMLRQAGEQTFCPIIPTGLFALSRVHNRKAVLIGVEKPGPVGSCRIRYGTSGKGG